MKDPKDNKTVDAFARQPMTPAERQRLHRERKKANGKTARIDCYISVKHKQMLDGVRKDRDIAAMLEQLIEAEYAEYERMPEHYHSSESESRARVKQDALDDQAQYDSLE